MAENETGAEKTEKPTAKRLNEARQDGNIPKSTDLNNAVSLLLGMILLFFFGRGIFQRLVDFTRSSYEQMAVAMASVEWFLSESPQWILFLIILVSPFMVTLAVVLALLTFAQVGPLFTLKAMKPNFMKFINPIPGLLKIFGRDNWVRLAMTLLKVALIVGVSWWLIADQVSSIQTLGFYSLQTIFSVVSSLTLELGIKLAILLLILGIIDYQYQKFTTTEKLKMTKEEVKEETKQMEGDPKIRQKRRRVQMELARERMMNNVQEADVIVTNPVELAVALKYDPEIDQAPRVVAKGARLMAQRIKEIARLYEVPIYEHKPLARALFEAVEVDEYIPERLYQGVATILAYVWDISKKKKFAS